MYTPKNSQLRKFIRVYDRKEDPLSEREQTILPPLILALWRPSATLNYLITNLQKDLQIFISFIEVLHDA